MVRGDAGALSTTERSGGRRSGRAASRAGAGASGGAGARRGAPSGRFEAGRLAGPGRKQRGTLRGR
nr:hypothetical protein [Rhodothermus marinus]